eukprot:gnl/MRDRNA2_/MRDRNA2_24293_c0_seq1.p1 gnl/MRDRNA2_/MRDRNA2_24293_c0~~gnl/MRDRNA2_/MRDRNA2_24293_c0_seq1.p1  ORF type:complete len:240 (-),score=37.12 gnl/MRDRNA2_/MRDRNA2_24293_c0_seq1:47-697(-)
MYVALIVVAGAFFYSFATVCGDPHRVNAKTIAAAMGISTAEADQMILEAADPNPSEIQPRLFLGNVLSSQDWSVLKHHKITHIINATSSVPNKFADALDDGGKPCLVYKRIPLEDSLTESISDHLPSAVSFIDGTLSKKANARVLVHCQQGVGRSACIIIAYLMHEFQWTPTEAIQYIKQHRFVQPNKAFLQQLEDYYAELQAFAQEMNDEPEPET